VRRVPSVTPHLVSIHMALAMCIYIASACSPSRRPNERDAGEDGGSDGGDTDLTWDAGTDTDVLVLEPVLIFEDPPAEQLLFMSAAFDGTYIAVSRSDVDLTDPYTDNNTNTLFLSFPWESPEDVMIGSMPQSPPACSGAYGLLLPDSVPHPHPNGFLLLTATRGNEDCELVQTLWDHDANLLDGPHTFGGLFSDEVIPSMDPNGIAGEDGTVTTGTIKGEGFDETDTEATVYLDVDKWGSGGTHERVGHVEYSWSYSPDVTSGYGIQPWFMGRNIYFFNDAYSVFGFLGAFNESYTNVVGRTIFSRIGSDGVLLSAPGLLENDTPPVPPGLENTTFGYMFPSFSSNEDAILEVAKVLYLSLDGFSEYEPSTMEPFPIGLWTRKIDFLGTPIGEWVQICEYESHVKANPIQTAWSGRYYAACYNEPFDTFKMIAMDENGIPISAPIDLFWKIPPVENKNLPCDLVAIDEDTFVAILGVYTDPEQPYKNGLWATRVDVNIPIE
jgi:hypothetical protein